MLSKLAQTVSRSAYRSTIGTFHRSFADVAKKSKSKEYLKVTIFLGVSIGTCYGGYKYATDTHVREVSDEKVFIHVPWLLKKLHKWFPLDCYTPFTLQVEVLFWNEF